MRHILILALLIPTLGNSQNDTSTIHIVQKTYNNQIDLDIEFIAFSFGYKHRIAKKWMFGTNIGLGVAKRIGTMSRFDDYAIGNELIHLGVSFQYNIDRKLQLEIGPEISIIVYYEIYFAYGSSFGVFYGNKLQIGINFMIGWANGGEYGGQTDMTVSSSALIFRVPIRW